MPRMLETMRETFWVLALAVIALFAFFVALGAFSPADVIWVTIVVGLLCVLWIVHAVLEGRHRDRATRRSCARGSAAGSSLRAGARPRDPADRRPDGGGAGPAGAPRPDRAGARRARARDRRDERAGGGGRRGPRARAAGPGGPCARFRVRALVRGRWRPRRRGAASPLVAYLHGGGWAIGTLDAFDPLCRALANASGALIAAIDYRLAPEHPFPAAPDDVRAAVRWLAAHAAELGADPARLGIAGDSAGGNLAAVTARRLRDEGDPPLRFQALIYPVCDSALNTPSYRENGSGFGLTAESMKRYWELYLDGADGRHPDASPLRADDLAGLPPAFVLTVARRRAARRGRGVRARARGRRRAGHAAPLRRRRARLLPLAREERAVAPRRRGGRRGAARRARLADPGGLGHHVVLGAAQRQQLVAAAEVTAESERLQTRGVSSCCAALRFHSRITKRARQPMPRGHPRGREPEVDPAAVAGGRGGGRLAGPERTGSASRGRESVTFWSSCQLMHV